MSWAQSKETCPWGPSSRRPGNQLPARWQIRSMYLFFINLFFPGDREPRLCRAFQVQLQWPGRTSQAQGPPPGKPGGDCSSEASVLKGQGVAAERQLG